MIKKILVAYNGSKEADQAFTYALGLAKQFGASIITLSVVRVLEPPEDVETKDSLEQGKERFQVHFDAINAEGQKEGISVKNEIVVGHPAEQIIFYASDHDIDLIVLGHHKRSKLGKWLVGSIARKVIDHAPCTVLVYKPKEV